MRMPRRQRVLRHTTLHWAGAGAGAGAGAEAVAGAGTGGWGPCTHCNCGRARSFTGPTVHYSLENIPYPGDTPTLPYAGTTTWCKNCWGLHTYYVWLTDLCMHVGLSHFLLFFFPGPGCKITSMLFFSDSNITLSARPLDLGRYKLGNHPLFSVEVESVISRGIVARGTSTLAENKMAYDITTH